MGKAVGPLIQLPVGEGSVGGLDRGIVREPGGDLFKFQSPGVVGFAADAFESFDQVEDHRRKPRRDFNDLQKEFRRA